MSKGQQPRPLSISYKQYSDNYEAIFGKKELEEDINSIDMTDKEEEAAEERMKVIGQNGNDGLHYDEVDGES
jgi:hypothetical protein